MVYCFEVFCRILSFLYHTFFRYYKFLKDCCFLNDIFQPSFTSMIFPRSMKYGLSSYFSYVTIIFETLWNIDLAINCLSTRLLPSFLTNIIMMIFWGFLKSSAVFVSFLFLRVLGVISSSGTAIFIDIFRSSFTPIIFPRSRIFCVFAMSESFLNYCQILIMPGVARLPGCCHSF